MIFSKTFQTLILNLNNHIGDCIIYNYEQKIIFKMRKIQDFVAKINLFFYSLPISPWEKFALWLHLEAPKNRIVKFGVEVYGGFS